MNIGDMYEIRKGKPGGIPIIRIERVDADGHVWVSDWADLNRRAPNRPLSCGQTFPDVRPFARADEVRRVFRHWRKLPANTQVQP